MAAQERYAYIASLIETDLPPPARVVELGAAPGDQIVGLARRGYDCTAVDIGIESDAWAEASTGRMVEMFTAVGVESVTWNLEKFPYPLEDDSFDAVVMTEVFEHLRDYPIKSLNEAARILRSGGRLYFTTPNQTYIVNRIRLAMGRNVQSSLPDWIGGLPFARHAREYTFDEIDQMMRLTGLKVVRSESRHFHLNAGRQSLAARSGKKALNTLSLKRKTLGPQIIVVAEKPRRPGNGP